MRGFIVFCLLLSSLSLVESGSYCYQKLTAAQNIFNTALGISGADWFSGDSLRNQIQVHYMTDPPTGMRTVCTAAQQYKNSLGQDYDRCFRVIELIRNDDGTATNVTRDMATNYFAIMNRFSFTCGAGFAIFINDQSGCLPQTFNTSADGLQYCLSNYRYQVQNGDDSMLCAYTKSYLDCYSNVFTKCGDIGTYFGCEYARVAVLYTLPACNSIDLDCMVNNYNH